jgi:hypothetical protein
MKAVRYHSYGASDVLVVEEVDRPVTGPGQVVLRVAGTAFNLLAYCRRCSRCHSRTFRTTTSRA